MTEAKATHTPKPGMTGRDATTTVNSDSTVKPRNHRRPAFRLPASQMPAPAIKRESSTPTHRR